MLGIKLSADAYVQRLQDEIARTDHRELELWADLIYQAWENEKFVFIFGNGGSGCNASHMAEDLGKSTLREPDLQDESRKRLKVLSLTDNVGWIMALGNDVGYDQIFVQQLMNYGSRGDLVIAISGSGNSPNVLQAVDWANRHGLITFGLTGYDGGKLKQQQQHGLHVPLDDMGMVESIHMCLSHWVLNDVFARINGQGGTRDMYLGIEIGGTKLQLAVGSGDGKELAALERVEVDAGRGASDILEQIERLGSRLVDRHPVSRVGVGFGGPVDSSLGNVIKSHQIKGWNKFPLANWCRNTFGIPAAVGNDCNVAAVAEACCGAGQGRRRVFYVTVGTGVGGGFVIDGQLDGGDRPAVAEIGHLRPGLHDDRPDATVEALASGWGMVAEALARIAGQVSHPMDSLRVEGDVPDRNELRRRIADLTQADEEYAQDLLARCDFEADRLTAKTIAQAAREGNEVAQEVLTHASQALGWAIAQVITLLAPEVVIVGGGVAQMGQQQFLVPLRQQVARFVFPPLAESYEILPSPLGELVVVHGALLLAAHSDRDGQSCHHEVE